MSEVPRRFRLIIDQAVAADLIRVKRSDQWAHAKIIALLQEYASGALSPDELIDEKFESDEIKNIEPFWHLQRGRLNVFRVKMVEINSWRILTAGDYRSHEVAILAVMHRDQNYQADKSLIDRIKASYEKLGFRELGR